VRYRIYRVGSLEVRTVQEADGQEEVGMVFSVERGLSRDIDAAGAADSEKIVKVSEYVERGRDGAAHFFVVAETDAGSVILTETSGDATPVVVENPKELSDRVSLAKTIRVDECRGAGRRVEDLWTYQAREAGVCRDSAEYAQCAFSCAAGEFSRTSGLRRSTGTRSAMMSFAPPRRC